MDWSGSCGSAAAAQQTKQAQTAKQRHTRLGNGGEHHFGKRGVIPTTSRAVVGREDPDLHMGHTILPRKNQNACELPQFVDLAAR